MSPLELTSHCLMSPTRQSKYCVRNCASRTFAWLSFTLGCQNRRPSSWNLSESLWPLAVTDRGSHPVWRVTLSFSLPSVKEGIYLCFQGCHEEQLGKSYNLCRVSYTPWKPISRCSRDWNLSKVHWYFEHFFLKKISCHKTPKNIRKSCIGQLTKAEKSPERFLN